ncbi:M14 family metallopeptidase [Hymenobacter sp. H14-R3]|uniref:M14 metallopeptidase family protein n=1 Tax=Hymenobacter sp. H14-R3 TaxID=3046308 RepID=UPI0024B8E309|nr:M14 metallopeptidase family protein [Hymenobacter sp. H14-R3]MDJ0365191.1 M14 family metallopeptidase [Hymenobacter sp. H14-R3]
MMPVYAAFLTPAARRCLCSTALVASLLASTASHAQTTPPGPALPPTAAADAAGPLLTPAQFLGYALGSQFTPQADVLRYAAHVVAHAPGRMRITRYGQTYEKRTLEVVEIGNAENFSKLAAIQLNDRRLASLEGGVASRQLPAVAWLSYNVHGNEAVSSEAVLQVLYDLANPQDAQMQGWLKNTVVVVDPCVNPDGHDRYVNWYNRVRNQNPNAGPDSWEHHEPWPGGRYNHYYFDLNRDWAWQTQQESRQRIVLYNKWLPQVHADFHEMGPNNSYYFSPAAKPFHADITPWQRQFQNVIGDYNRKVFDANNWLYFTREVYDLFAPTYGDTWPSFNGAIGMTYEQGGGGPAGVAYARTDGDTLTLAQRIAHHHAASRATIQATAERHDDLLREFQAYFTNAKTKPGGAYKTYVLASGNDPGQLRMLTQYLERQQIDYGFAPKQLKTKGFNYSSGKTEAVTVQPHDVLVSMYQPKSTLVKVLFEPRPQLEDSLTYDITSWALPYSFGVKAYALAERLDASGPTPTPAVVKGSAAAPTDKPYAYLARWNNLQDVRFLSQLLQKKVKVRFAEQAFEAEGQKYTPGTLIITRTGNEALGAQLDQLVRAQADSAGTVVRAVKSGFSTTGHDLGSGSVHFVKQPTVAVVAGPGVDATAFGEVWHFFEQQIGYPITVLGTDYLSRVNMSKIDVLILPDGNYQDIYPAPALESLKAWVRGGGKLIAMEGAMKFLANKKDFLLKAKTADSVALKKAEATNPYLPLRRYGTADRESTENQALGTIYQVQLDNTHPLAFGYGGTYSALIRTPLSYKFLPKGGWNVGVIKKNGYYAGFSGSKARKELVDTFVLGEQDLGRGQVIYLGDNPLFRAFWQSGKLLFGNAVFLVGQ